MYKRQVLENDLVEAIIGLPTDMFYNTGISTYIWILTNRKPTHRKGLLQLIDASSFWQKMRKSLGSKRKELSDEHIAEITRLFGEFVEAEKEGKPISRIFKNTDFGYRTITVAVSYTHLDVYKRQFVTHVSNPPWSQWEIAVNMGSVESWLLFHAIHAEVFSRG